MHRRHPAAIWLASVLATVVASSLAAAQTGATLQVADTGIYYSRPPGFTGAAEGTVHQYRTRSGTVSVRLSAARTLEQTQRAILRATERTLHSTDAGYSAPEQLSCGELHCAVQRTPREDETPTFTLFVVTGDRGSVVVHVREAPQTTRRERRRVASLLESFRASP